MAMKLVVEQEMFSRAEITTASNGDKVLIQVVPRHEALKGEWFTRKLNNGLVELEVEELTPHLRKFYKGGDFLLFLYKLTPMGIHHFEQGHNVIYIYRVSDIL